MKLLSVLVFIMIIFSSSLIAEQKRTIHFTPLPMQNNKKTIEKFIPLIDYLQNTLPLNIKFNYQKDYEEIINGFIDGTIDIAYLGPFPYALLKSKYEFVKPIVVFKRKDGTGNYRCAISKFSKDKLDLNKPIKVALTQPESTCGYYFTNKLLKEKFSISLEDTKYNYTMSHTNALTSVMREEYLLAGSSEDIARKYESLGMEIIALSEALPGLTLVVNTKTLSLEEIDMITNALLNIPKQNYEMLGDIAKYGVAPADVSSYDIFNIECEIPKKGNIDEI